jgi:hypothetical protein
MSRSMQKGRRPRHWTLYGRRTQQRVLDEDGSAWTDRHYILVIAKDSILMKSKGWNRWTSQRDNGDRSPYRNPRRREEEPRREVGL